MEFNPNNPIIQLCMQGMAMEEMGKADEASALFLQARNEATNDFEKFIAAWYVARHQKNTADKLKWYQTALEFALSVDSVAAKGALPSSYLNIGKCYEDLGDADNAKKNRDLASSSADKPADIGPFYHGTKADLQIGDLLIAGFNSNYKEQFLMNHIYFTAMINGAGLAAALAKATGASAFI